MSENENTPDEPTDLAIIPPGLINLHNVGKRHLILPDNMDHDEWEKTGDKLEEIKDAQTWWVGDWLLYGELHYPDRYQQAIKITGDALQTLYNKVRVSKIYPPEKRVYDLDWTFYEIASGVPDVARERLLEMAVDRQLGTKAFRALKKELLKRAEIVAETETTIKEVHVLVTVEHVFEVITGNMKIEDQQKLVERLIRDINSYGGNDELAPIWAQHDTTAGKEPLVRSYLRMREALLDLPENFPGSYKLALTRAANWLQPFAENLDPSIIEVIEGEHGKSAGEDKNEE